MHGAHLNAPGIMPGLASGIHGGAQVAAQPRLVNAAHEFEAQLMKELMKPLASGVAPGDDSSENGEDSGAGSTGALGDFAAEAFARALSNQGGFGIANKIIDQLAHRTAVEPSLSGTESGSDSELSRAIGNGRPKSSLKPLR